MFGSLNHKIKEERTKLKKLNEAPLTQKVLEKTREVENNLDELLGIEEVFWDQRLRAWWQLEGDRNTTFYHQKENKRSKVNSIQRIKDDTGNVFTQEEDIGDVLMGFFSLFMSSNPVNMADINLWWKEESCQ